MINELMEIAGWGSDLEVVCVIWVCVIWRERERYDVTIA